MTTLSLDQKLALLAEGARYDASCASSGERQQPSPSGGICHSWSADGRCVSLLKLLMTNACIYDCAYCINRRSNDISRTTLTPTEVADLTINFYRRNYIEGLFLSTGVIRDPDYTMELLIATAHLLRTTHGFPGYLHIKVIPGAAPDLIGRLGRYADRVSVNIELPSEESLVHVAPEKNRKAILDPMTQLQGEIAAARAERKKSRRAPSFAPAGQSTQMIVGASSDDDRKILRLASSLYRRMELSRIYYSAFLPVNADERLPALTAPPLLREHRLYQADWLMRFYGFGADEILEDEPYLDLKVDPKAAWAIRHPEYFPVEIQKADLHCLLRVPGIGVRSARRLVVARRVGPLKWDDLRGLGLVMKRARFFITVNGLRWKGTEQKQKHIRRLLVQAAPAQQLELFPVSALPPGEEG